MAKQVDLKDFAWGDLDFQPPFDKGAPFILKATVPNTDPVVTIFQVGDGPYTYWIMIGQAIIANTATDEPYRPKFFSLIEAICWLHMHLNPEDP